MSKLMRHSVWRDDRSVDVVKADEAEALIAALEADAQRLRDAIRGLLREHPVGVDCNSFHHDKRDLHILGSVCPPYGRYIKAVSEAYHALDGKPEQST